MNSEKYGFKNFTFCDSHSDLVDDLCKTGGKLKYFDSMYELFTLAACIGFKRNKKVASLKTGKSIEFNQFRSFESFDGIFLSICLADAGSADILEDTEDIITKRLSIFSEYANGGMEVLRDEVINSSGVFQENLIHFIKDSCSSYAEDEQSEDGSLTDKFTHLFDGL